MPHKYLGINIDYSSLGKVKFTMVNYIGKMLDDIPRDMKVKSETPDSHHFFDASEDATKLSQTDADLLNHFVVQILYLSKQERSDIWLVVYFK